MFSPIFKTCPKCDGNKHDGTKERLNCPECDGLGKVKTGEYIFTNWHKN